MKILQKTQSLCPVCLRTLDAHYREKDGHVYFEKFCPEHGFFSVPAWMHIPKTPSFKQWIQSGTSSASFKHQPHHATTSGIPTTLGAFKASCPQNCGLCSEHQQQSCCVLLEITQACTMQCPICYASAQKGTQKNQNEPSLEHIQTCLRALKKQAGQVNIQLSGGEPTMREDLLQVVQEVRACGFNFVQINSNGLRLGHKKTGAQYAKQLKEAGLNLVYLQWDAAGKNSDDIYTALRGAPYAQIKEQALQHCLEAQLPVLLVTTLVRGVNDANLGTILHKALDSGPLVRGLHIQPVASFGRYPWQQSEAPRLTIPEILHALETQSDGMLQAQHFHPPQSEHALCSFSAVYTRNEKHGLSPVHTAQNCCCTHDTAHINSAVPPQANQEHSRSAAKIACDFVARHWSATPQTQCTTNSPILADDFDRFLEKTSLEQRFTVSGMAFQDAYSIDLARLRRCHIHILQDIQGEYPLLKPFCAFNVTSTTGFALHRGKEHGT